MPGKGSHTGDTFLDAIRRAMNMPVSSCRMGGDPDEDPADEANPRVPSRHQQSNSSLTSSNLDEISAQEVVWENVGDPHHPFTSADERQVVSHHPPPPFFGEHRYTPPVKFPVPQRASATLPPTSSLGKVLVRQNSPYTGSHEYIPVAIPPPPEDAEAPRPGAPCPTALHRIVCIRYRDAQVYDCLAPRDCSKEPHLKLGGVNMDLNACIIGFIIHYVTGIQPLSVDMFQANQGRCSVTLYDPEAQMEPILRMLNKRLWLGPEFACVATSPEAAAQLQSYVDELRQHLQAPGSHVRFPRHLVTVERWIPKATYQEQDA